MPEAARTGLGSGGRGEPLLLPGLASPPCPKSRCPLRPSLVHPPSPASRDENFARDFKLPVASATSRGFASGPF